MNVFQNLKKIWKHVESPFSWLLVLFPIFIAAVYIYKVSVNIPIFDEWAMVPMVEKWQSGNGHWLDILQSYLTPKVSYLTPLQRIAAIISTQYFHWDIRFEIASGFAVLLGTSGIFILYAKRIGALSKESSTLLYLFPIMLLLFSLRQQENLIAPWGINFFGTIFFVMGTAFLLTLSESAIVFIGAIIFASMASLSFINGLLIWLLGLILLLIQRRRKHACYWIVIALLFLSIYFGFLYIPISQVNHPLHPHFSMIIRRFLSVLGAPLSMDKSIVTDGIAGVQSEADYITAQIIGLSLLFTVVYLFWKVRQHLRDFTFPITGVLFALASCLMIAYGRADLGLSQVFASRYTPQSILLLMCLVTMLAQLRLRGTKMIYLESGLLTIILLSSLYGTLTEYGMANARHHYLENWAAQVKNYNKGGNLTNPHFPPEKIYEFTATLDRMKLTIFHTTQ